LQAKDDAALAKGLSDSGVDARKAADMQAKDDAAISSFRLGISTWSCGRGGGKDEECGRDDAGEGRRRARQGAVRLWRRREEGAAPSTLSFYHGSRLISGQDSLADLGALTNDSEVWLNVLVQSELKRPFPQPLVPPPPPRNLLPPPPPVPLSRKQDTATASS
jgi:hypothetical protein